MEKASPETAAKFDAAVEHVNKKNYPSKHKLRLYGLYKHITVGKCNTKKPSAINFGASFKYEAWKNCQNMTLAGAMEAYIKLVAEIDPTFKPENVQFDAHEKSVEIQDLNTLPPPLPPNLHGKYFKSKTRSSPNMIEEIQKQSGFDPINGEFDNEARISLHEKLVRYYREVDSERLIKGIGEIVDFGLIEGETKLNERLKKKYGLDLIELEEREQRRLSGMDKKISSSKPNTIKLEKFENIEPDEAINLSKQIEDFFLQFDPEKVALGKDTGFVELIRYVDKRGVEALNKKLMNKYGKSLVNLEKPVAADRDKSDIISDKEQVTPTPQPYKLLKPMEVNSKFETNNASFEMFQNQLNSDADIRKFTSGDSFTDIKATPSDRDKERVSKDSSKKSVASVNKIELPDYVRPALVSFYARYEQERLRDGSFKKVYGWARRNGLRKLNKELKKRYKQSLDEFVEASDKLKLELVSFYTKIDESKLENGLEKIWNWGVKNGRVALNNKLLKKYGFDLDTYQADGVVGLTGNHEDVDF